MGDMWLLIIMLVMVVLFCEGCHWYVRGYIARGVFLCTFSCVWFGLCVGQIIF